ncbi:MAG: ACT domain-containing protein [Allosphingosinicella sp.]
MSGETDLARLLAALAPVLDAAEYGFEVAAEAPPLGDAFALIREDEGVTIVRPGEGWARITLGVHSSLEAVGLTARVAAALAARGVAANPIAGFHHDHLFVPWDRRDEAMAALRSLSDSPPT